MEFKVGDVVECINSGRKTTEGGGGRGWGLGKRFVVGRLTDVGDNQVAWPDNDSCGVYTSWLKLVDNKGDKMSDCNNKEVSPQELRDLKLSADELLLVEAGVTYRDGSLTDRGRDMVFDHMFDQVKDSLVMDIKKVKKARGDK